MRKFIAVTSIAALIAAGMPISPASAQTAATPVRAVPGEAGNPIASILNSYPNGGAEMRAEITDLVVRQPQLAADLVSYVKSVRVNAQQRKAVHEGLADALTQLKATNQAYRDDRGFDPMWAAAVIVVAFIAFVIWNIAEDEDHKHSPN